MTLMECDAVPNAKEVGRASTFLGYGVLW